MTVCTGRREEAPFRSLRVAPGRSRYSGADRAGVAPFICSSEPLGACGLLLGACG